MKTALLVTLLLAVGAPMADGATLEISSRISGVVMEIMVKEGDRVTTGAPLARLDPALFQIGVKKGMAKVSAAAARAEEERRYLERKKTLYNRGLIAPAELEEAQTRAATMEAELALAEAELAEAELFLSWTTIRAPVAGVVEKIGAYPGQVLNLEVAVPALFFIKIK